MAVRIRRVGVVIEVAVVLFVLCCLGACVAPLFSHTQRTHTTSCVNCMRYIATAIQMYVQDSEFHYPGRDWNEAIGNYVGSRKVYIDDNAEPSQQVIDPIYYGYNGLLIQSNGQGTTEALVKHPECIGVIADATPVRAWEAGGGIFERNARWPERKVMLKWFIHIGSSKPVAGTNIGFADGHVKFFPGDTSHPNIMAEDAIYRCIEKGWLVRPPEEKPNGVKLRNPQ